MTAERTIREYYQTLRDGDPLHPYFAVDEDVVKFGISERLDGYEEIDAGLREQTEMTEEWTVESRRLQVIERDEVAWFSDDVRIEWTQIESGERLAFDTRWSGTLERRNGDWKFVGMHVSAAHDL